MSMKKIAVFGAVSIGICYAAPPTSVNCNQCTPSHFECEATNSDADDFNWSWQPQSEGSIQVAGPKDSIAYYSCNTGYGVYPVQMKAFGYNNGNPVGEGQEGFTCNLSS
jgi:hypothetical protein